MATVVEPIAAPSGPASPRGSRPYRLSVERDDNFLRQAAEFVAAIREGRDPSPNGEDGRAALAVALAIYRSAETGQVMRLDD